MTPLLPNGNEKLNIEDFGRVLITTGDLDPIYVMLYRARTENLLSYSQLCNWCTVYWCNYHAGVASYITQALTRIGGSERSKIWTMLHDLVDNVNVPAQTSLDKWPRGTERRHFRGLDGKALVSSLAQRYGQASQFVDYVYSAHTFDAVAQRVQSHTGFGPWIAFKIADMGERVFGLDIDFRDCQLAFYKEPVAGAVKACSIWASWPPLGGDCVAYALERLQQSLGSLKAPPDYKRNINIQELETVLCKWKSHMHGHYPVGKDTAEIKHGMINFGTLARELSTLLPEL